MRSDSITEIDGRNDHTLETRLQAASPARPPMTSRSPRPSAIRSRAISAAETNASMAIVLSRQTAGLKPPPATPTTVTTANVAIAWTWANAHASTASVAILRPRAAGASLTRVSTDIRFRLLATDSTTTSRLCLPGRRGRAIARGEPWELTFR